MTDGNIIHTDNLIFLNRYDNRTTVQQHAQGGKRFRLDQLRAEDEDKGTDNGVRTRLHVFRPDDKEDGDACVSVAQDR